MVTVLVNVVTMPTEEEPSVISAVTVIMHVVTRTSAATFAHKSGDVLMSVHTSALECDAPCTPQQQPAHQGGDHAHACRDLNWVTCVLTW